MTTILSISVDPRPKSKSQQLAALVPGVEAALREGHSHEVIHNHIKNTLGLDLTYQYYKTTLKRIRKRVVKAKAIGPGRPPLTHRAGTVVTAIASPALDSSTDLRSKGDRFTYELKAPVDDFF